MTVRARPIRYRRGPAEVHVRALAGFLLFSVNCLVHAVVAFHAVLLVKLLVWPVRPWREACDRGLVAISFAWTVWNTRLLGAVGGFGVDVTLAPGVTLDRSKRYLLVANHQTWTDIFVLQAVFHPRTPFLSFFLKRQLLYVPVFGVIWWSLGFPFMQRYPASVLAKRPELKHRDLETTKEFCARLRGRPYAIINFVEGTRRTPAKAAKSPYRHLLPPKAGGIATALQALDYEFDHVLDVTIRYGTDRLRFIDLLAGRTGRVAVDVREVPLADVPRGDYFADEAHAARFREWLNAWWAAKDARLG